MSKWENEWFFPFHRYYFLIHALDHSLIQNYSERSDLTGLASAARMA